MLSQTEKPASPLANTVLAVATTLGLLMIMGITALLTQRLGDRTTVMAIVSGAGVVLLWGLCFGGMVLFFRKLGAEKRQMKAFAIANSWAFDGVRHFPAPPEWIPPSQQQPDSTKVLRFRVSGELNGQPFDLYHLYGLRSIGGVILRVPTQSLNQLQPPLIHEQSDTHSFIFCAGAGASRQDIQLLFSALQTS